MAGLGRALVVRIEPGRPVRFGQADRVDDGVAEHEGSLTPGADLDARVAGRVAGRVHESEGGRQLPGRAEELEDAGCLEGLKQPAPALDVPPPRRLPVELGDQVGGVGEGRPAAPRVDVEADVVAMEVREDDDLDICRRDAGGRQLIE